MILMVSKTPVIHVLATVREGEPSLVSLHAAFTAQLSGRGKVSVIVTNEANCLCATNTKRLSAHTHTTIIYTHHICI